MIIITIIITVIVIVIIIIIIMAQGKRYCMVITKNAKTRPARGQELAKFFQGLSPR